MNVMNGLETFKHIMSDTVYYAKYGDNYLVWFYTLFEKYLNKSNIDIMEVFRMYNDMYDCYKNISVECEDDYINSCYEHNLEYMSLNGV